MNQGTQDPAQLEQIWLSNLEAQSQLVYNNLQAFLAAPPFHSSAEFAQWVSYLSHVGDYFTQYRTMALYLKGLGFNQLFERVEQVVGDVHRAGASYAEMYQNALTTENKMFAMNQAASQQWFDAMQEVMKTRQAAFDAANAQWEAAFKGR